jgi:hypothetical protein
MVLLVPFGRAGTACRAPTDGEKRCVALGRNLLLFHDITHSRELKRRELQGGEDEMAAIQRHLNGNFDGD